MNRQSIAIQRIRQAMLRNVSDIYPLREKGEKRKPKTYYTTTYLFKACFPPAAAAAAMPPSAPAKAAARGPAPTLNKAPVPSPATTLLSISSVPRWCVSPLSNPA